MNNRAMKFAPGLVLILFRPLKPMLAVLLVNCFLVANLGAQVLVRNHVANPNFHGNSGQQLGTFSGEVPAQWRGFALDGGGITTEIVPLAANALYAGSPATNAVRVTVNDFGASTSVAFDHFPTVITLDTGLNYKGRAYMRSENPGGRDQDVRIDFPLFSLDSVFLAAPGSTDFVVTDSWTEFTTNSFTAFGPRLTHLGFRLLDDLDTPFGSGSILISLPEMIGLPQANRVPNPGFVGTAGLKEGDVTGPIPDNWRGFGVAGGAITTAIVPVAANELYPGSPPTNAVQLTTTGTGSAQGLDHEGALFRLDPANRTLWSEVWLKSVNQDNSDQDVFIQVPIFDAGGFTGQSVNSYTVTANSEWNYFGGGAYLTEPGTFADMSFRLVEDLGDNSVLIALPRVNAIQIDLFNDGFETLPP